jgi:Tfp pilus assembly major pilin PilA
MKTSILAGLIVLVALPGVAQTPSGAPVSPAVTQSLSTAAPEPSAPEGAIFAANGQLQAKCTAIASCGGSSTVQCSGTSCAAEDRNCGAFERGHATCRTGNTTTTVNCPSTCNCENLCVCGVPCSTECVVGASVQECGSWGICATSCACGGECLPNRPRLQKPDTVRPDGRPGGNACASLTSGDDLLSQIFR